MLSLFLLSLLPAALAQTTSAAADDSFVGYVYTSGSFVSPRSCSYPQTASTSGSYFQCCNPTGSCPFYTSCSGNSLFAASATVACYVDPGYTCNTGIVETTVSASDGVSYLACWSTALGTTPFTLVQDIGTATPAATSSGSAATATSGSTTTAAGTTAGASTTTKTTSETATGSTKTSATAASTSSSATATAAAANVKAGILEGGALGLLGYAAQLLI